jgi:serine phosphatase RsbU (regulator of sigma subunit)
VDWGVAVQAVPGQHDSGDIHIVKRFPGGVLLAVADGLGHGTDAAAAAHLAQATIAKHAEEPVISIMQHCHGALRFSRGAAISLASVSARYSTLTWLGVGNVEGILLRADCNATPARETIMLLGGVVGFRLPNLRAAVISIAPGDTLVFCTDGVQAGGVHEANTSEPPQRLADRICSRFRKGNDDALVLVARYLGAGS